MRRNTIETLALIAALGCGGSDGASLEVTVAFPGSAAEVSTNSLHVWVVEPAAVEVPPGCRELELGEASPYDLELIRHADLVVIAAEGDRAEVAELPRRPVLVYVEGVDFLGVAQIAGCEEIELGGAESITVALRNRGALDCADPTTPEGAPCDDGMFCNVGETCSGGACQGGGPRNCTHLADDCNGESCTEELGCQPLPVPNGTPCFDGAFCTAGDTCLDGVCDPGGDFDCTAAADDCNVGVCEEGVTDAICTPVPTNEAGPCAITDCDTDGTCDAAGNCVAGIEGETGSTDPTCSDTFDNDCDGMVDAADPDCQ